MKRFSAAVIATAAIALALSWNAREAFSQADGWVTLLDGTKMGDWDRLGEANWRTEDGAVVVDKRTSKETAYLVSKNTYTDFMIRAEFWADAEVNSGIFIRCADPKKIGSKTCYEVNIYDKRKDPTYGTGAIVDFAEVNPMPTAAGKWNTLEITAKGRQLAVTFNGQKTADIRNNFFTKGPIALQYGSGVLKWRKVQIKPL